MDHRLMPRLPQHLRIQFGGIQTLTADVSSEGFCVELIHAPRPGTLTRGTIQLGGEVFEFAGHVCWSEPADPSTNVRARFGVRFTDIPTSFFEALETVFEPLARAA